jgi:hypothetical protein
MRNASAPIVWLSGDAFVVESFPVADKPGRVLDHWIFRRSDGVLGLLGFVGAIRQRMKFSGSWTVIVRDLDAPRGSTPVFQRQLNTRKAADDAFAELVQLVRRGNLPTERPTE